MVTLELTENEAAFLKGVLDSWIPPGFLPPPRVIPLKDVLQVLRRIESKLTDARVESASTKGTPNAR